MAGYILRRAVTGLLVLIAVSILAFTLTNVTVDPAVIMAGEGASDAEVDRVRELYGFNQPVHVQYADWLSRWITGDFGNSLRQRRPVTTVIAERFPATAIVAVGAILLAVALAVPLGILAAVRPNSIFDRLALFLASVGTAMPSFWLALLLIVLFGVHLRWLPITGSSSWKHFVMPIVTLGFYTFPPFMRLIRVGMIEALGTDFVRTARAKGLRSTRILFVHALRYAAIPVVALSAVQLGNMLGGTVVIETVFAVNGLGLLSWEAIKAGDLPVLQSVIILGAFFYVALTFVADVLTGALDPRVRIR